MCSTMRSESGTDTRYGGTRAWAEAMAEVEHPWHGPTRMRYRDNLGLTPRQKGDGLWKGGTDGAGRCGYKGGGGADQELFVQGVTAAETEDRSPAFQTFEARHKALDQLHS
eukprot:3304830-Rhodomonas_salina.4